MSKAPEAFRTISEVAEEIGVEAHVLRFWESRFPQIKPLKRGGGRRYYRPADVALLKGIHTLLYNDGYSIKGVQKVLREQGMKAVSNRGADREALVSDDKLFDLDSVDIDPDSIDVPEPPLTMPRRGGDLGIDRLRAATEARRAVEFDEVDSADLDLSTDEFEVDAPAAPKTRATTPLAPRPATPLAGGSLSPEHRLQLERLLTELLNLRALLEEAG